MLFVFVCLGGFIVSCCLLDLRAVGLFLYVETICNSAILITVYVSIITLVMVAVCGFVNCFCFGYMYLFVCTFWGATVGCGGLFALGCDVLCCVGVL